ncbi:MAG: TraR/DksA C4-type zinc finger protein [Pirellulales bacterium]
MVELQCSQCGWSELCDQDRVAQWLLSVGMLRRDRQPEPEIMLELLRAALPRLVCPGCLNQGLTFAEPDSGDDWPAARLCQMCRKPIPVERLEALPNATLCAPCQQADERGDGPPEVDYCERCGAPLVMKLSTGSGIRRYAMVCTGCGKRDSVRK